MKEQIKLLAEQAGIKFTNYGSGDFIDDGDCNINSLQKFAELITQEYANLCHNQALIESEKGSLESLHKERALDVMGFKIAEYFGVEE